MIKKRKIQGLILLCIFCLLTGCSAPFSNKTIKKKRKHIETTDLESQIIDVYDMWGSINGIALTAKGNNFEETLGKDGFRLERLHNVHGLAITNEKYPDIKMCVYGDSVNTISTSDIREDGFSGYHIDGQTNNKPKMTWNGLTWGASLEDVKNAYGTPNNVYQGNDFVELAYYYGNHRKLSFYVYDKETKYSGLQDVEMYAFTADEYDRVLHKKKKTSD